MRWYYPEKGELPDPTHVDIHGLTLCLCVFGEESKAGFDSDMYDIELWIESNKKFECNQFCYNPENVKRWCYLDEAISKLDE